MFDALKGSYGVQQAMILCHTPSDLVADESSSLGTHDLFDEFLGKDSLSLISVFPNVGIIRQAIKGKKDEPFTVDCILACHHYCDPLDVSIDVVGRFGIDFHHISEVVFVTDMPKGMYRPMLLVRIESGFITRQTPKPEYFGKNSRSNLMSF